MQKKIITLCGFLGSGKTTLLGKLLTMYEGYKRAILVNDFGDVPVDGMLLQNSAAPDEAILEISGGSVFCACLKDSFVQALQQISTTDAEVVFIEASGMADPAGFARLLSHSNLSEKLHMLHTICVFDPIKSRKLAHVLEVIPRQIQAADVVALTKPDLASSAEKEEARAYIRSISETAQIVEVTKDSIAELCAALLHPAETDLPNAEPVPSPFTSINTPNTRPESFTIATTPASLSHCVDMLSNEENILRVKGYLQCGTENYFISDTGRGYETAPSTDLPVPLTVICLRGTMEQVQSNLRENGVLTT